MTAISVSSPPHRRQPVATGLVWVIRAYQAARVGHVSPCRFTPTCSHYAVGAIEAHGARRGLALTARRLGRCRPGGPSGFDPVPDSDPERRAL
jgi:hypothetical protein